MSELKISNGEQFYILKAYKMAGRKNAPIKCLDVRNENGCSLSTDCHDKLLYDALDMYFRSRTIDRD